MSAAAAKVISMEEHRKPGPQLEDGYIRIANELFDAILRFRFTLRQQKVLLGILRKTYGYGKKSDDMSASQIGAIVCMPRPHVAATLIELEKLRVITRTQGQYGMVTAINKRYREWIDPEDMPKKSTNGDRTLGAAAGKRWHYVYRITHLQTGEFYIGVRSCDCLPAQDRYIGSGCWSASVKKHDVIKTVLQVFESRSSADEAEKAFIRAEATNPKSMNRVRYDSSENAPSTSDVRSTDSVPTHVQNSDFASTESEHVVVQNLNTSVVQNRDTQKTTFQKTTSKDNLKRIAQSADCAASQDADVAFAAFWDAFAYKKGTAKAKDVFAREYAKAKGAADWLSAVMRGAAKEAQRRPHLIADGQTPIYAQGWLTQRRYEDEDLLAWGTFSAEQQAFIDCFNANIGETCPQVTEWTEKRAALCDIAMCGKWGLDKWAGFWRYVRDECRFDWPVSFEWMLNRENWSKVKGGQYLRDEVQA